jgi:RNA polymerase sigma factor (sigma-70 family)
VLRLPGRGDLGYTACLPFRNSPPATSPARSFPAPRLCPETPGGAWRLIAVDPVTSPLEAVDAAGAHRTALADAAVVAAWTAHHAEVFAFLVRTTRSSEAAEDLLQEAFLRLTTEIRAGRAPDNTRAWLYRVGANLAVSRGRRLSAAFRGIVKIRSTDAPITTTLTPEASYLQREGRANLLAVLADLDPGARAALLLASEGFSGAEIAAAIGRSEAATRTLLCRTRMRVRSRLESAEAVP